jgi:hypothetical protein
VRRWAALAATACILLAASCAEIGLEPNGLPPPPPPRPVLREARDISSTFGAQLVGERRVDGLTIDVLVVGHGKVDGNMLSELKSAEAKLSPPIMVWVIKHPKAGIILFGSGLPEDLGGLGARRVRGAALSPFSVAPGRDLLTQLERRGIKAEDVKWVVLPDLAPEWSGRAGAFPAATVALSAQAWVNPRRRAVEADLPDPRAFVPDERLHLVDFSAAKPFGPFDHGIDLLHDGTLILVDLDGGAAGGMGLWVNLDSGPVLLTGPAAFVYDNVSDQALPDGKFVIDVSSFAWNTRAMKVAQEVLPRLIILPAHDSSPLKLSPRPDLQLAP